MLWRNHFLAGIAAGLLVAGTWPGQPDYWLAAAVSGISALVPDLDSPKSRLGKKVAPVSWTAGRVLGHRGVTHSLAGLAAAVILFGVLVHSFDPAWLPWLPWPGPPHLVYLFAAGYLSHLVTDCLTREGCPLLWPLARRFRAPLMATGSRLGEGIVTLAAVAFIAVLLSGR